MSRQISLDDLRKQHHALVPAHALLLPPATLLLKTSSQEYLISRILDDPLIRDTPPSRSYSRLFWRKILKSLEDGLEQVEDDDVEIDERIYQALSGFMVNTQEDENSETTFRTFVFDAPTWCTRKGEQHVTVMEERAAIQAGTTGLSTWTASLHLAHYILASPESLFPHSSTGLPSLVELGAGTGFLSILLATVGFDIIATDVDLPGDEKMSPLARLRTNVDVNKLPGEVKNLRVESLNWMDALGVDEERPEVWSRVVDQGRCVVAADVGYDPDLIPALVKTISLLIRPRTTFAIIAVTVRNVDTLNMFYDTCAREDLTVADLNLDSDQHPTFWDSGLDRGCEVRIMRITSKEDG